MAPNEIEKTIRLYASLMEEIKDRGILLHHLASEQTGLPPVPCFELCLVQIRKLSEILALGCLTAHGDIPEVRDSMLQKEWNAERILKRLATLHPDFFPIPHEKQLRQISLGENIRQFDLIHKEDGFLTREELICRYTDCGNYLHRGSVRHLLRGRQPTLDFAEIREWNDKFGKLLAPYHYILLQGDVGAILCVMNNLDDGGRVQCAHATTVVPPRRDKHGKLVKQRATPGNEP